VYTTIHVDQRISIFSSSDVAKYHRNASQLINKVYILHIKQAQSKDQGRYKCVTSVKRGDQFVQRESTFNITFVNSCNDDAKYFKCTDAGEKCIVRSQVCDGYSDCLDGSDEAASTAGCVEPVTTTQNPQTTQKPQPQQPTIPSYNMRAVENEGVITVRWTPVKETESYQMIVTLPDGSNNTSIVQPSIFKLNKIISNAPYTFQVRPWKNLKKNTPGTFSRKLLIKTKPVKFSFNQFNMSIDENQTLSIWWERNNQTETDPVVDYYLDYALYKCKWENNPIEWMTNESLVSDVKVYGCFNETLNKTVRECNYKNHTIHYDHLNSLDNFTEIECVIESSTSEDAPTFVFEDLLTSDRYSYKVLVYQDGRIVNDKTHGNFTVPKYYPPVIVPIPDILTGTEYYGIACGILVVILAVSFIIAYYTEWDKMMNDLELKLAKIENEQHQKEMDKIRPETLLVASYINDQTNEPLRRGSGQQHMGGGQQQVGSSNTPLLGEQRRITSLQNEVPTRR